MGRLTLNILFCFAQFEREVIGERIRDKFAASRKKGMWMGGWAPLGYDVKDRKLVINESEAELVRSIFERFVKMGSATKLAQALAAEGVVGNRGKPIDKGVLYKLLNNRLYIGEAVHKGESYPGEHEAIIAQALWEKVQAILKQNPKKRAGVTRAQTPALLKGLIFGPDGSAMSPTHTRRRQKLYRYYVSQTALKQGAEACPIRRVPAAEIEAAVIDQLRILLRSPEIVVATWRAARREDEAITEAEVREALQRFDPLWDELFPAEQARIVQLLVERVDLTVDGARIRLRTEGLTSLVRDLGRAEASGDAGGGVTEASHHSAATAELSNDGSTLTVSVPLTLRRRGGRKRIITPLSEPDWKPPRPQIDSTLVKALARAFRWKRLLEDGTTARSWSWLRPSRSTKPTSGASCGSLCWLRLLLTLSSTADSRQACGWRTFAATFRSNGARNASCSSSDS